MYNIGFVEPKIIVHFMLQLKIPLVDAAWLYILKWGHLTPGGSIYGGGVSPNHRAQMGLGDFRIYSGGGAPKGTVFFYFRGKVDAHSLTQILEHLYFFSKRWAKKNTAVFFFPGKVYVPLTQLFWRSLYKKLGGKLYFFQKWHF